MNKFLPTTPELIKQIVITLVAVIVSAYVVKKFPSLNGDK